MFLFRWANLIVIIVTLLSYLAPYFNPEKVWYFTFLATGYPWLLLLNILFIIFWVIVRKRYFLFSLICILLGINHLTSFVGFNIGGSDKKKGKTLNVMTYNISGPNYSISDKDKDINKLNAFIRNQNCDLICLQEYNHEESLNDAFYQKVPALNDLPYRAKEPNRGQIIFSKFPVINKGIVDFGKSANGCVWADINVNGKIIRVYSVHLESNSVSRAAEIIKETGDLEDRKTWSSIKWMFGRVSRATAIRSLQVKKVKTHSLSSPNPILICGDFNDTPLSYNYHQMAQGLQDAFKEKGLGLGTTFNGAIPALKIDYILADPSFQVLDHDIPSAPYSDHYPVISKIWIGN